jgi:hypothetical protein
MQKKNQVILTLWVSIFHIFGFLTCYSPAVEGKAGGIFLYILLTCKGRWGTYGQHFSIFIIVQNSTLYLKAGQKCFIFQL